MKNRLYLEEGCAEMLDNWVAVEFPTGCCYWSWAQSQDAGLPKEADKGLGRIVGGISSRGSGRQMLTSVPVIGQLSDR
jgi:hypothetical protein